MVGFGKPAANRAAGTYMKLMVKTAKYIRPFSKYDGNTGSNEEEYLLDFNSAFKVTWAAALRRIDDIHDARRQLTSYDSCFISGQGRTFSRAR